MKIGPMLEALPELLPLPWKHGMAPVSRAQAWTLIEALVPDAAIPDPGWELCLVVEATRDWVSSVHLVNQADPRNLAFVMGLTPVRSPLYLELRWRYDWRRAMGA